QELTLYIATGASGATVTVTIDSTDWWRSYVIPANTVIDIATTNASSYSVAAGIMGPIPKSGANDARLYSDPPPIGPASVGLFRKKAIHIESGVPVVAYAHIYGSASSGATMLQPVEAWGGLYTSANSNQKYESHCFSWINIISKYDNTVIEITPTVKTRGQNVTGLQPGVTKTITLMRGQIYQILGANIDSDTNGNGGTNVAGYELTGTVVKSVMSPTGYTHPIAVFSGSSRTWNQASCGSGGGDNDIQQHFPRQAMGKIYYTAPFSGSTAASVVTTNIYKVVVFDPTTVVTRNGAVLTGLVAGSYYTFESNTADRISADQPILVAQFMTGGNCMGAGGLGDPEMVYLSPVSQAITTARFYRNTKENITVNYVTLITPTTGVATLTIDGSSTFDTVYAHPNAAGYSVVVKRWTATKAQATIQGTEPFTGITYGLGSVESYGYNIGTKLNAVSARDASQLPPGFTGLLPLQLISFSAVRDNHDVRLTWATENEANVGLFEVQRSLDGNNFNGIANVSAKGYGNAVYNYADVEALNVFPDQSIYYRLKIVDKDGKFQYSAIAVVKNGMKLSFNLTASPNPFNDRIQLQVQTETPAVLQIQLRDLNGKIVYTGSRSVFAGQQLITIMELGTLPRGIYLLEATVDGKTERLKLLK
ncbi:MAG TPA: T9SS type A sorting domain-containing protein, partial [Chitinophagaceae bacterium]